MNATKFGIPKYKKLFVSVPMKGQSEKDIRDNTMKLHCLAESFLNEKLELINSFILEEPSVLNCNIGLWYLSKSLEKLSMADVFIGIEDLPEYAGCRLERLAADAYNIKSFIVDSKKVLFKSEDIVND